MRSHTAAINGRGPGGGLRRFGWLARMFTVAVATCFGIGAGIVETGTANAYPWDPHVRVWFNVSACAGASGQWGWFNDDQGESGWVQWNAGYQGYFDLWRVTTSGTVTRIQWGTPGRTCGTRFYNITRPVYGNVYTLGWIG